MHIYQYFLPLGGSDLAVDPFEELILLSPSTLEFVTSPLHTSELVVDDPYSDTLESKLCSGRLQFSPELSGVVALSTSIGLSGVSLLSEVVTW